MFVRSVITIGCLEQLNYEIFEYRASSLSFFYVEFSGRMSFTSSMSYESELSLIWPQIPSFNVGETTPEVRLSGQNTYVCLNLNCQYSVSKGQTCRLQTHLQWSLRTSINIPPYIFHEKKKKKKQLFHISDPSLIRHLCEFGWIVWQDWKFRKLDGGGSRGGVSINRTKHRE